jgi:hypothetical protein
LEIESEKVGLVETEEKDPKGKIEITPISHAKEDRKIIDRHDQSDAKGNTEEIYFRGIKGTKFIGPPKFHGKVHAPFGLDLNEDPGLFFYFYRNHKISKSDGSLGKRIGIPENIVCRFVRRTLPNPDAVYTGIVEDQNQFLAYELRTREFELEPEVIVREAEIGDFTLTRTVPLFGNLCGCVFEGVRDTRVGNMRAKPTLLLNCLTDLRCGKRGKTQREKDKREQKTVATACLKKGRNILFLPSYQNACLARRSKAHLGLRISPV